LGPVPAIPLTSLWIVEHPEDALKASISSTGCGMRINGQRVATWSSQNGWSGDTRPEAERLR
jgi:hypothetical protein